MSTRGAYGYRADEKDYIVFNRSDSYLTGLAVDLIEDFMLSPITKKDFLSLNLIPTENEGISEIFPSTIKSLINDKDVDITFVSNADFLDDSLFCEHAYIFNLDTNELEFYTGFNSVQYKNYSFGRYAKNMHKNEEAREYRSCYLFYKLKFSDIANYDIKIIQDIENFFYEENIFKLFENI